ncbi:MAG: carbonic anhydrase family protein [Rhodoferax sp.]|jgi:carbonic anhydrase|nr:carbonic anhydrase family protein [Rhodoferax sp.]
MNTTPPKQPARDSLACAQFFHSSTRTRLAWSVASSLAMALAAGAPLNARSADHPAPAAHADAHAEPAKKAPPAAAAPAATNATTIGDQVRSAVESAAPEKKNITLVVNGKEKKFITIPEHEKIVPAEAPHKTDGAMAVPAAKHGPAVAAPRAKSQYIRAKTAALTGHSAPHGSPDAHGDAHGGEVHWSYEGSTGPQAWGKLKPDFNVCAIGKRQSPINIEESATLQGPAEPLQFNYQPSSGTVVNNGHTIQVDLFGDNTLTVRGSTYKLLQFHFHTPSEEQINYRNFAMVAHLVHKNAQGQLAVVAVLLDPGVANALINKVWTYIPLDTSDQVRLPAGIIDMNELLPKDQRYYQFMGSLTTPPCTEGVLWMVLKQPTTVSREQIKLFTQLFPHNARPTQPVNGRAVRNAQ